MSTYSILWTVLPVGLENGSLRFSIYVSPRLDTADKQPSTMGSFPLDRWPARIAALKSLPLLFELTGGRSLTINAALAAPELLDPALWNYLFGPTQPVRPHGLQRAAMQAQKSASIYSYSAKDITEQSQKLYHDMMMATAPLAPAAARPPSPLRPFVTHVAAANAPSRLDASAAAIAGHPGGPADGVLRQDPAVMGMGMAYNFHRAAMFHRKKRVPSPAVARPAQRDFHELLAHLGDYPLILRRLGIIIDVIVPSLPTQGAGFSVRVDPGVADGPSVNLTPATACVYGPTTLRADVPRDRELREGMLQLQDPSRFAVLVQDVDGTAHTLNHFAKSVVGKMDSDPGAVELRLPGLRTGGFSICQAGRDSRLFQKLQRTAAMDQAPGSAILYGDDLLRGYRVDVQCDGSWFSLCRRTGSVTLQNGDARPIRIDLPAGEEGYVKSTAATSNGTDLYLHEALFGWDGWSLCAGRPGMTVEQPPVPTWNPALSYEPNEFAVAYLGQIYRWHGPGPSPTGAMQTPDRVAGWVKDPPPDPVKITADIHAAPRSLPRLRFGKSYRFRARAVDLAGNSLPYTVNTDTYATELVPYLRYELLASPTLVPRAPICEGESVEHLVIRSNGDATCAAYADKLKAQLPGTTYGATCERHVAPPKTSQLLAELHGCFDRILQTSGPAAAYEVAKKEAGTFLDMTVLDTRLGTTVPTSRRIITPAGVPAPATNEQPKKDTQTGRPVIPITVLAPIAPVALELLKKDTDEVKRGDPLAPGQYVIHEAAQVILPYLPDPLAAGVALGGLPQAAEPIPFQGSWPELLPFRLVLAEGTGTTPSVSRSDGAVVIGLPKGTMLKIPYSSTLKDADLPLLAHFSHLSASEQTVMRDPIRRGQVSMFTPSRELTLVHAVQQPLAKPQLAALRFYRAAHRFCLARDFDAWSNSIAPYGSYYTPETGATMPAVPGFMDNGHDVLASGFLGLPPPVYNFDTSSKPVFIKGQPVEPKYGPGATKTRLPGGLTLIIAQNVVYARPKPHLPVTDLYWQTEPITEGAVVVADPGLKSIPPQFTRDFKFDGRTGQMVTPRRNHCATVLADGRVLITGGVVPAGVLPTAELYDLKTNTFQRTAGNMTHPRRSHAAHLLADGTVLLVGGCDDDGLVASAELYDPQTDRFSAVGSMHGFRQAPIFYGLLSTPADRRVFLLGGQDDSGQPNRSIEVYDPQSKSFSVSAAEWSAYRPLAVPLLDGRLLLVGTPVDGGTTRKLDVFDPRGGSISSGPVVSYNLPALQGSGALSILPDGKVVFSGDDILSGNDLLYDAVSNTVREIRANDDATRPSRSLAHFSGSLLCDSHSTGQLDIEASWNEYLDLPGEPGPRQEPHKGHVYSMPIAYEEPQPVLIPQPGKSLPRQEFGDTKARRVRYQPIATTRYREYFPPALTSDPANLTTRGEALEVVIPATAPPVPPRVLYAIPTFKWQTSADGTTRTRVGRGLRIYVERPWYSSGEGEQLEVYARLAADPLTGRSYSFADGAYLSPQYNAERQLWFFDYECGLTELAANHTDGPYFPFIQLSVCRYQPAAIPGARESTTVTLDFVQLTNDRTATLLKQPDGSLVLTLTGTSVKTVEAVIESCAPDASPELGWQPTDVKVTATPAPGGASWQGVLRPGDVKAPSGTRLRVVLRERDDPQMGGRLLYTDSFPLPTVGGGAPRSTAGTTSRTAITLD